VTIGQTWWITCDRSDEDGITCVSFGGETPQKAEEAVKANGWISYDGYHQCPRHPPKERQ
jgi:hypothetical protein